MLCQKWQNKSVNEITWRPRVRNEKYSTTPTRILLLWQNYVYGNLSPLMNKTKLCLLIRNIVTLTAKNSLRKRLISRHSRWRSHGNWYWRIPAGSGHIYIKVTGRNEPRRKAFPVVWLISKNTITLRGVGFYLYQDLLWRNMEYTSATLANYTLDMTRDSEVIMCITRDSEVIMFSPCVFVCVWLSVYVCHDVCPDDLT